MSTKCTIDHGPDNYWKRPTPDGVDFHLYYECCDDDNVYLEISNCVFAEVSTDHLGSSRAIIAIPGKLYNFLIRRGELKSWGGEDFDNPKTQEQRDKEFEEGIEESIAMLGQMAAERRDKDESNRTES